MTSSIEQGADRLIQKADATDFTDAESFQALTDYIEAMVVNDATSGQSIQAALAKVGTAPYFDKLKVAVAGATTMMNLHSEATGDVLITLLGLPVRVTGGKPVVQLTDAQRDRIVAQSHQEWLGQPDTGMLFTTDCIVPLDVLADNPYGLLHEFVAHLGTAAADPEADLSVAHAADSQLQRAVKQYAAPENAESFSGVLLLWELWGEGQIPPVTKFQIMSPEAQRAWISVVQETLGEGQPDSSKISLMGIFPILDAVTRARNTFLKQ